MSDPTSKDISKHPGEDIPESLHRHDARARAAVVALRRYSPEAKDVNVYKQLDFLKGKLFMIEWWDADKKRSEYSVYVRGTDNEQTSVFSEMEQMADYLSEHRHPLERYTDAATVTAFLAFSVLVVLTALQIIQGDKINPIFTNALTLILGFYFGQKRQ